MSTSTAVAVAVVFVWLGMVAAISFIEAPLKFRAPNVTLVIGLGIGRLVFRALNIVETVWATVLVVTLLLGLPGTDATVAVTIAVLALAVQVIVVRPRLTRRTDAVLAGLDAPRSHVHYVYIALEVVKTIALLVGGIVLLASA
ncbi:hypothetical protein [Nocardia fluminea]|uniref:Transmembrane protein n=1 Tax=Nocardia fluminea TaxID=134984 RepID=A0A2N3VJS9_9NOCA|nr:hypothetical protein [Nocardia fluminea]PKV81872.1 hypothetical protein ATK86_6344 [Nocardia fluminea]